MNRFLRIILVINFAPLLAGCGKGALVADPYWAALVRMQGENPKVIAANAGLSYFEVSGRTEEDIRNMLLFIMRLQRQGQWLILSPWMAKFAEDINKNNFRVGLLSMQGLPVRGIADIREVKVLRNQVLEDLLKPLNEEKEQVMLFYNSADDFYTFTHSIKDPNNLFAMYVGSQDDIERIEENARTILALRNIKAMFILAEPYNYALWQRMESYLDRVENVYSGGVRAENKKFHLISDNIRAQIQAIMMDEDLNVEAELKK